MIESVEFPEDGRARPSFQHTVDAVRYANEVGKRVTYKVLNGSFEMYVDPGENPHVAYNTRGPYCTRSV